MEKYKHSLAIQIRFSDIDPLNHVNNSCVFQYYDVGRINYMEDVVGKNLDWSHVVVVIVHIEANFLIPILKSDNIEVQTHLVGFGTKSMTMQQRIIDIETGMIKSTCTTILSGFNRETSQSMVIPEDFKQKFFDYEA
ncbi:MAG: thioesterase family protein [Bacteroidales bacterium]|jgi:acyl-CoA thioester hydrolase|nr:thioesterase family protein [Bacteroidales bacterium]